MNRSDDVYLKDIVESVKTILFYAEDKTEDDFLNNVMLQDAVVRRFEIIGEATTRISETFKSQHPMIQWRLMKAMRNKLIHEYFGLSPQTLFHTIKIDLPILVEELKRLGYSL